LVGGGYWIFRKYRQTRADARLGSRKSKVKSKERGQFK
jgi:hypothetical protein